MKDAVALSARLFAAKPIQQPKYNIRDVPKCSKDLSGSILQEITDRDMFTKSMAEMVLLCNEVTRRRDTTATTTKSLNLEYIEDRLTVDDPLFGFIVRTKHLPSNPNLVTQEQQLHVQEQGMIQGFITITTFTNYQRTFRWDSMHDSAFSYDQPDIAEQMWSRQRKVDVDGSLSAELQNTVRCGNVWEEGVVFPHIAEISLLGALGCSRTLVSLAIERLEGLQSIGNRNYDYVALQATKNSVQFYETMGFVRVGAITEKDSSTKQKGNKSDESVFVSEPTAPIITTIVGQTPLSLSELYNVNVWDIIFLNQFKYPTLEPRTWLKKGIQLICPDPTKFDGISNASHSKKASIKSSATQWYLAANNETPKQIAKRFNVPCTQSLITANRERFQDLSPNSKLKPRTRIQVSNLSTHHTKHVPYCHWTDPDDDFENNEPSYMMARRLNRRKGVALKLKPPFESSLRAPIEKYDPKPNNVTDIEKLLVDGLKEEEIELQLPKEDRVEWIRGNGEQDLIDCGKKRCSEGNCKLKLDECASSVSESVKNIGVDDHDDVEISADTMVTNGKKRRSRGNGKLMANTSASSIIEIGCTRQRKRRAVTLSLEPTVIHIASNDDSDDENGDNNSVGSDEVTDNNSPTLNHPTTPTTRGQNQSRSFLGDQISGMNANLLPRTNRSILHDYKEASKYLVQANATNDEEDILFYKQMKRALKDELSHQQSCFLSPVN